MRPTDLERLFKDMRTEAPSRLDQRVYSTIDNATAQTVHSLSLWRKIMRSPIIKLAIAAAFIVGCLFLANHLVGGNAPSAPQPSTAKQVKPTPTKNDRLEDTQVDELALAQTLYQQKDLPALLTLLEDAQETSRLKIAEYLAEIGDATAIPVLQKLADLWQGPPHDNPFQMAIEAIQLRLSKPAEAGESAQSSSVTIPIPENSIQVTGTVMDKSTGRPIPGAAAGFDRQGAAAVATDFEGQFTLTRNTAKKVVSVYVRADGYASKRLVVQIDGTEAQQVSVALGPGAKVVGVVRTQAGQPVAEAEIEVWPFVAPPLRTDNDGAFSMGGLDPMVRSGLYTLHTTHPGYPHTSTYFSPPAAGEIAYQDIILKPGVTVYGQVRDAQGQAQADVTVDTAKGQVESVKTDAEGRYRLVNVPAAPMTLWAASPQHAPYIGQHKLSEDDRNVLINIQLPESRALTGRVVDSDGNAVAGAELVIDEYNSVRHLDTGRYTCDPNGRFVIPHAPVDGDLTLRAFGEGIAGQDLKVDWGQSQQVITVKRVGRIYGKVTNSETDKPIPDFRVRLSFSDIGQRYYGYGATWIREGYSFRSQQGHFDTAISSLAVGHHYKVTVYADGFNPCTLDPVTVQRIMPDPNRTAFVLEPASLLSGRVVDPKGMPIPDATAAICSAQNTFERDHWRATGSDEHGIFTFTGVDKKDLYIFVSAKGFAPKVCVRSDFLQADQGLTDIVLFPEAGLSGTVSDANGGGRANALVRANLSIDYSEGPRSTTYRIFDQSVRTDQNGYYQINGLTQGQYSVTVSLKSNSPIASRRVSLASGERRELNFSRRGALSLSGVARVDAHPLSNAQVKVDWGEADYLASYTDQDGKFVIPGMDPGQYHLAVQWYPEESGITRPWSPLGQYVYYETIDLTGNQNLDINVGHGSIQGVVPDVFRSHQGLALNIRRKGPDTRRYGQSYSDWQYVPGAKASIDSQGQFEFVPLHTGQYCIILRDRERVLAFAEIDLGPSEHLSSVPFDYGDGQVMIQVIDTDTGEPIPNARFGMRNAQLMRFYDRKGNMRVDKAGVSLFTGLPSGEYRVIAEAQGYLGASSDLVAVRSGQVKSVVVELSPGAQAHFSLSEDLLKLISTNHIDISCRVIDSQTQTLVKKLSADGAGERYGVDMKIDGTTAVPLSMLSLPAGQYEIHYRIMQYVKGAGVVDDLIYEGTTSARLRRGQVNEIPLP